MEVVMKRISRSLVLAALILASPVLHANETDLGVSTILTPFGGTLGPSLSTRFGDGWIRGGFTGNFGVFMGLGMAMVVSAQPDLYIGPKEFSLHLAAMGAGIFAGGEYGTVIAAGGIESELGDHIRIHADVYVPPTLLKTTRDKSKLIFPAFGARILGPEKKMFVDLQVILTNVKNLPVLPTISWGVRF